MAAQYMLKSLKVKPIYGDDVNGLVCLVMFLHSVLLSDNKIVGDIGNTEPRCKIPGWRVLTAEYFNR